MGIVGFIVMLVLVLLGLNQGVQFGMYVDTGSIVLTVFVTLAALLMSYGSDLGRAIKAVFSSNAGRADLQLAVLVFSRGRSYALACGSLGTVIGLVIILKNLDHVSALGPGLALALLTLAYGIALSYLVLGPVVGSLKRRLDEVSGQ